MSYSLPIEQNKDIKGWRPSRIWSITFYFDTTKRSDIVKLSFGSDNICRWYYYIPYTSGMVSDFDYGLTRFLVIKGMIKGKVTRIEKQRRVSESKVEWRSYDKRYDGNIE
jgi:hypothetical protein